MMLHAPQGPFGDPISDNTVGVVAILAIFVGFPIAVALARLMWRKGSSPETRQVPDHDTARRLAELQQSMDAMALEIERISENQRFVTKLMSEMPAGSLPSGKAGKAAKERGERREERGALLSPLSSLLSLSSSPSRGVAAS